MSDFLSAPHPGPLLRVLPAPKADAYDLYRQVVRPGRPSFLLESGKGPARLARYSFFGSDPYLVITGAGSQSEVWRDGRTVRVARRPFELLTESLRASRLPARPEVPPFWGGAVGFFSYDLVRQFERLPNHAVADPRWPDLAFALVDLLGALDHEHGLLYLMFSPPRERLEGEPRDKLYREGCDRLAELQARLAAGSPLHTPQGRGLDLAPGQSRAEYMERVCACQEFIRAGDIYQANLSHRFTIDLPQPAADMAGPLYAVLRRVNPSPFSALLVLDDLALVGSSPERLVRLHGARAETRPIAGTRGRGLTAAEDQALAAELLGNSKERAEHLMLVDLERNDLGRVCRHGSIRVEEFMTVERYSHVSHLVSNVSGDLSPVLDGFDLIRAVFPGGTITGVPKIRCMEIIERLEPVRRGPYTGSLGYLSWSGDVDLNIIIRTLVLYGRRGYVQVGAGIVADSDASREYDETLLKAGALLEALKCPS